MIKSKQSKLKYNLTNKDFFNMNYKSKKIKVNSEDKENNIQSMSKILNKLIKIKKKINQVNLAKKKKENLIQLFKPNKTFSREKLISNNKAKNKYLLYINDYYNNRKKLFLQKNKTISFEKEIKNKKNENFVKTENDINLKTISNIINDSNRNLEHYNSLDESIRNQNNNSTKRIKTKNILENISSNRLLKDKDLEKKKTLYFSEKNKNILNNNKIMNNHIKYIEKIRDNELMDLINRYKKSLNKNKVEEILHYKSRVFPSKIINYLIQMKNELTIDKFRNEYINKLDRFNTHNILRAIRYNHKNFINSKTHIKDDLKNEISD